MTRNASERSIVDGSARTPPSPHATQPASNPLPAPPNTHPLPSHQAAHPPDRPPPLPSRRPSESCIRSHLCCRQCNASCRRPPCPPHAPPPAARLSQRAAAGLPCPGPARAQPARLRRKGVAGRTGRKRARLRLLAGQGLACLAAGPGTPPAVGGASLALPRGGYGSRRSNGRARPAQAPLPRSGARTAPGGPLASPRGAFGSLTRGAAPRHRHRHVLLCYVCRRGAARPRRWRPARVRGLLVCAPCRVRDAATLSPAP